MSVLQHGFDLDEFFGEHEVVEDVVTSVTEMREQLREYNSAKNLESEATKRKAEAKKRIQALFAELPEEYKTSVVQPPKTVAGHIFARVKKVITLDGWNMVFNEKVNTKAPRDKYIKELEIAAQGTASVEARDAYIHAKTLFESHLDPTLGNEFKIEPTSEG